MRERIRHREAELAGRNSVELRVVERGRQRRSFGAPARLLIVPVPTKALRQAAASCAGAVAEGLVAWSNVQVGRAAGNVNVPSAAMRYSRMTNGRMFSVSPTW